jgi:NAD(P)-dependent dehydrogenase (short-subunit alcohol dehydrogenase family)
MVRSRASFVVIKARTRKMDLEFSGKVALITGGGRGIGKGIAQVLAREGVDIAIGGRDMATANATAEALAKETGRKVRAYPIDTSDDATVTKAVAAVIADFGRIDILVNNAAQPGGQAKPPKLTEITDDYFWADVNVKVMGYIRMARAVAPHMVKQGWGRVINVSGLAARQTGSTVGSIRNVSVAALTKNMADELGPSGINVTCIHPGLTRTEKTPGVIAWRAKTEGVTEEAIEKKMASGNTIRQFVDVNQIANVVAFLASPKSIAINGDSIGVGGGALGSIHY